MNENSMLDLLRRMYRCEKNRCDTCTEYDGSGCKHPENCRWNWDYENEAKKLGIEMEMIAMDLKKAVKILDGCIPHPSDKMVDREHIDIAIAWYVIKEELESRHEQITDM